MWLNFFSASIADLVEKTDYYNPKDIIFSWWIVFIGAEDS